MSYARSAVTRMTLDVSRPDLQRSETVTQGDTNRRWDVTLINGGAPFRLPPNWTAALTGIKPDGNGLLNGCSVVDGKIIYDFAAGKEIATCVGGYPVQFDIWDEVGELVASPKVYVNVLADVRPHAELESNGQYTQIGDLIGRVNQTDADVDILEQKVLAQGTDILAQGTDIAALKKKITTAGTVTIPVSEWTDAAPTVATAAVSGVDLGSIILMLPADEQTKLTANNAKLSAYPTAFTPSFGNSSVTIFRAEAETIPESDMTFVFVVLKAGTSFETPIAAIIGVDAYGEGGGVGGLTQAETEMIVKKIVPAWARSSTPPDAQDVRADPEGTAKTLTEDLAAKIANDLGNYYPKAQTYTRTEIDGKISAIPKFEIKVVSSLPTSNISDTTVYLVKDSTVGGGLYTEYIRVNGSWEELGSQSLDMSGYVTDDELEDAVSTALAAAKDSGEFTGRRGWSILTVKSSTTSASGTGDDGTAIKYRIALSAVKSEAGVDAVYVGDIVFRASQYIYPVVKVDASYVYLGEYSSIKGSPGTSVSISSVTESTESGGENVVTFSNGKTLTVKNGKDSVEDISSKTITMVGEDAAGNTYTFTIYGEEA